MRYLLLILLMNFAIASEPNTDQAIKVTQQALLATPTIKTYVKNLEKRIVSHLPIDRNTAGTIAAMGITLGRGQINTDPIKGMRISAFGGKIRPDVSYDFRNKGWGTALRFNLEFK
jgi:hypothetical protein